MVSEGRSAESGLAGWHWVAQIREPHDVVVKPSVGTTVEWGLEDLPPSSCLWMWAGLSALPHGHMGLSTGLPECPGNLAASLSQESGRGIGR